MGKSKSISINYIDTCYPDYLQDHHHRDGECLISICLASQTEDEAVGDILNDINGCDMGIPEDISDRKIKVAAREAVKGLTFHPYDDDGNEVTGKGSEAWDAAVESCESRAYFYASWE